MILEVAILDVIPDKTASFEQDFQEAQKYISAIKGYGGHQLQKCIGTPYRYILFVRWQQLEDHTIGFRQSAEYQEWKKLLHHYYSPFPVVAHYESVFASGWKM
jgi:heme-degrading monooxygenase HmoA